ncbi:hypothetical protein AN926_09510 [Thermus scotoductus]|uniref:DUF3809 domain-containing protein n=1 Tax=Thermus scotoductus TaxID=37636 RepID=A0A0N0IQ28_THESC|nr:hypothetical protein AN926_09510 [Thermus scotoductus]
MRARFQLLLGPDGAGPEGLPLELSWDGGMLKGVLRQENPVLGEIHLAFQSRLDGLRLSPLPLPPPSLEVGGEVQPQREGLLLKLEVALALPEGKSWGERAFSRLLQAVFFHLLGKTLSQQRGIGV